MRRSIAPPLLSSNMIPSAGGGGKVIQIAAAAGVDALRTLTGARAAFRHVLVVG